MTAKRKSETRNPVNYWWNKLAFPKYFSLETDLSPIEVVERLNAMQQGTEGLVFPFRWTVDFQQSSDGTLFCIQRKRLGLVKNTWDYQRRTLFTSIQADCVLQSNFADRGTLIQGHVRVGRGFLDLASGLIVALILHGLLNSTLTHILLAGVIYFCLYVWFLMCYDRTYFTREIEAALQKRKAKEK